ncbi:hypothetical protein [Agaribacterium haliotis]|uniref:hypothetical protein n=1 Tax=Agaribacterium haliotis TaxID=2013869 RepID=UPI001177AB48|nr:hypothetical protein [Agaribacterium haliotis]
MTFIHGMEKDSPTDNSFFDFHIADANYDLSEKFNKSLKALIDRIDLIKQQHSIEPTVLATYEQILNSRLAITQWLKQIDQHLNSDMQNLIESPH